jgi:hypothetical protein
MSRLFCYITLFVLMIVSISFAQVSVVESTNSVLRINISVPEIQWEQSIKNEIILNKPSIKGFITAGLPGSPELPATGRWVIIPSGKRAVLTELSSTWEQTQHRRVIPVATPVMRYDSNGEGWLGDELLLPGEIPVTGELFVSESQSDKSLITGVKLGSPVKWRGQMVQSLTIVPLEVSVDGYSLKKLESAIYEINFIDSNDITEPYSTSGDTKMESFFINPEQLNKSELLSEKVQVAYKSSNLLSPEIRLPVTDSRLHRVTASSLKNYGLLDASVLENELRLYQRRFNELSPDNYDEIEVPILMVGDGGEFDGDDYFIFYGLRLRDDPDAGDPLETYNPNSFDSVNSGNIYYLSASSPIDSWARMNTEILSPASGAPLDSYRRVQLMHEDNVYAVVPYDRYVDRNRWNAFSETEVTVSVPVYSPVPDVNNVRVTAELFTFSTSSTNPTREVIINFGDSFLSQVTVSHQGTQYDSGNVLLSDLLTPDLTFECTGIGSAPMASFLNKFSVEYDAKFEATNNKLDFNCGTEEGLVDIELTGFTSDQISLFNLTDPHNPIAVALNQNNILSDGDRFKVSIIADNQGGMTSAYSVAAGDLVDVVNSFSYNRASLIDSPVNPTLITDDFDLFVIYHPEFISALEPWIQHRIDMSGGELSVQTMDIHSVYDWFSGGIKKPEAIRRAVQFVKNQNGAWALQLVGDANENVRSLGGTEYRDWVPSRWHCWDYSGYANEMLPSDKWFVASNPSEAYPEELVTPAELLVGRFPCNSADQLTAMVDKIIAFETASPDASWKKRGLFLADDAWSSGYSGFSSNTVLKSSELVFESKERYASEQWSYVAGGKLDSTKVFLNDTLGPLVQPPGAEERNASEFQDYTLEYVYPGLFNRIDAGASIFRYQGHANDHLLAHERIVLDSESTRNDVQLMSNQGKPWIFFGFGCHISTWTKDGANESTTGLPSIAEKMLLLPNRGAVATYASSGYEFSNSNGTYSGVLTDIWMSRPPKNEEHRSRWVIGELLQTADAELIAINGSSSYYRKLVSQFCLLGDPLMVVDCGSPDLYVTWDGQSIDDGQVFTTIESAEIELGLVVADEAGVDAVYLIDSAGDNLSEYVLETTPEVISYDELFGSSNGQTIAREESDQVRTWQINLPVRPFDHSVSIHAFDTADADTSFEHSVFTVNFPVSYELKLNGEDIPDEFSIPAGSVLDISGTASISGWVDSEDELMLVGQNLVLKSGYTVSRDDGHTVSFNFEVELPTLANDGDRSVILLVNGYETEMVIEHAESSFVVAEVSGLSAFPIPTSGSLKFIFNSFAIPMEGRIPIWDVSGNQIASLPITNSNISGQYTDGSNYVVVPWNGRDRNGDEIANGVYLYRVELSGGIASEVQKLVVMH